MPDINIRSEWGVVLNTDELRLVLKALGGRLNPDEALDAKALGDRLAVLRAHATLQMAEQAEKLLQNVAKGAG